VYSADPHLQEAIRDVLVDRNRSIRRMMLVEPSPDDADAMLRTLREWQSRLPIHVMPSAAAARRELGHEASGQERPVLILIDLPDDGDITFLRWIKSTATVRRIPVVTLVTSTNADAIGERYERGANSALHKRDRDHMPSLIRAIADYWLNLNEPPPFSYGRELP
jgi:DNA-binding NarL/FixJ family response regulator